MLSSLRSAQRFEYGFCKFCRRRVSPVLPIPLLQNFPVVSISLVLTKSLVCFSFRSKAFLEFISCLSFSVLHLNDGSLLASCSASWINPLNSLLVVGLGNSVSAWVSSLFSSAPSLVIVFPAYWTVSPAVMLFCQTCRLMLLHLLSMDCRRLSSVG